MEIGRPPSLEPLALDGHTGVGIEDWERAGLGGRTGNACSMVVRIAGAGLRRLADVAVM